MKTKHARATDPETSLSAVRKMIRTGTLKKHCQIVRSFVMLYPNCTARELTAKMAVAGYGHLDYHEVMRRLNDVATKSGARACAVKPETVVSVWVVRGVK